MVPLEDRKHLRRTLKVSSPLVLPGFSASFDKGKKGLFTLIFASSVDCVYFCKTLLQIKGFPAYVENRSFSDIQDTQYFYVKKKESCNTICTVFSPFFLFFFFSNANIQPQEKSGGKDIKVLRVLSQHDETA